MIELAGSNVQATVAKLKKTSKLELWVSLREYQGKQYVDLREHFLLGDDRQWHPAKKGVMISPTLLADVIVGIEALPSRSDVGTVATIPKSKRDEIQVGVREFEAHRYGEVRTWYDADGEKKPSNKGVTFRLDLVDALLVALRAATNHLGRGRR